MASKPPRESQRSESQRQLVAAQWSGPLPPPQALERFNAIIPNGAERIIGMVEREQAHRLELEAIGLHATVRDTKRGHWMGLTISLAAIAAAAGTAYFGAHPTVSIALVSLPIVLIVRAMLGRKASDD